MFRLTLETIRARKARFVLTAVAVVLGVAFMAGTLVLTDTISKAYDGIAATEFASTDVVVQSPSSVQSEARATERGTIPASTVDAVRRVDGVTAAEGIVNGTARLVGRDGKLVDDSMEQTPPIGMVWPASRTLNPLRLVARATHRGRPTRSSSTAPPLVTAGSHPATRCTWSPSPARRRTPWPASRPTGPTTTPVVPESWRSRPRPPSPCWANPVASTASAPSVPRASGSRTSRPASRAAVPADANVEVVTGTAAVATARTESQQGISFMSTFLLVFAVVALIVGGFVIFNAFSITVAQRTKETALLRAIGSSRRQVLRMIVVESVIVGVVASAVGALMGVGLARGLAALLGSFGVELPGGSTVVAPRSIAIAMTVGTVITVLAAYLPARRASKVAPIAAMRDVAVDSSGSSRRRAVIGTAVTALGAALLVGGASGGAAGPIGLGALALFAGVVVLGPVVAPRFVRIVGAPVARLRGMTGVLARDNASRNPKRTAATASALMIGVALVVLISVFATSARSSINANIDTALRSDWVIAPLQQDGLSPTVAQAVDALPETASVTTFRTTPVTLDGATVQLTGIDPATVEQHLDVDVKAGAVSALGAHELGVLERTATENHWHVGDHVTMNFVETGAQDFTVAMIYGLQNPLGEYTVSEQAYAANVAHQSDQAVFVIDAPGVSQDAARTAIEAALASTPTARLRTPAEFKADVASQIDKMLNLIYVLLFLAVVIALFGIANTLALSVVERRRELGLLRAVGMQRRQVRSSIRWEAVLIALLGTAVGTALGVGFGWALVKAMGSQGIDHLAVPGARLVVVAVVAGFAAVAAAALPARRAARLDALEAITS